MLPGCRKKIRSPTCLFDWDTCTVALYCALVVRGSERRLAKTLLDEAEQSKLLGPSAP